MPLEKGKLDVKLILASEKQNCISEINIVKKFKQIKWTCKSSKIAQEITSLYIRISFVTLKISIKVPFF